MPNVLAAYMQGQQAVENNKRNKLLQMQVDAAPAEQERRNKLLDLQMAGQQQNLDAGKFELDRAREQKELQESVSGLGYIINSATPKAEAERRYPKELAQLRQQIPEIDSYSDDDFRGMVAEFRNQINAKLGVGPAPSKPKLEEEVREDGSILLRDPVTGDVKEAAKGPDNFRAKADYSDQLARRRDAEQREFQLSRDREQAGVQRELAKIRAAAAGEKPTDGQRLSAGFLLRMQDVEPSFGGVDPQGTYKPKYVPTTKDYVLFNKILKNEGGVFGSGTAAELNKQLSPEAQEHFQQASDWVRAKLRKESGAVISPQEMLSEVSTYFPLPGDSPKTIQNKARGREVALEAMKIAAGSSGSGAQPPPRQQQGPKQITSEAEYNQLPPGTQYISPDGQLRQKR